MRTKHENTSIKVILSQKEKIIVEKQKVITEKVKQIGELKEEINSNNVTLKRKERE